MISGGEKGENIASSPSGFMKLLELTFRCKSTIFLAVLLILNPAFLNPSSKEIV